MDDRFMIENLPKEADSDVRAFVSANWSRLGGYHTIFKRVSRREASFVEDYLDIPDRSGGWAAECRCTECSSVWYTAWAGEQSIYVAEGEDGTVYPIRDADDSDGFAMTMPHKSGDLILCPYCGTGTDLIHVSKHPSREFRQHQFIVTRNIGGYTAVISWLAGREIFPNNTQSSWITPWVANVIDTNGVSRTFRYDHTGWRRSKRTSEPETTKYPSGDGWGGFVLGGTIEVPSDELAGQTGEKTGLAAYLNAGGMFPTYWLKQRRKHPGLENLVKSHFAGVVADLVNGDANICYSGSSCLELNCLRLDKLKPHEMVGMSKGDFRAIAKKPWTKNQFVTYRKALFVGLVSEPVSFAEWWEKYKYNGFLTAIGMTDKVPGLTMDRIDRYLVGKQGLRPEDLHHISDMWRMFEQVTLRPPRTHEELWPARLIETHDRLSAEAVALKRDDFAAAFALTAKRLAPLCWTDGELCIVIPTCKADLVREGEVLRHCVGGYSKSHTTGSPVFFVRHYRRPERPYYTLNINLLGKRPKRVQLHGYGNERHGEHKQYSHKIPKKVLDFCDRWEREVLAPFWAEYQKQEVSA